MTDAPNPRGLVLKDGLHPAFATPLLVQRFDDQAFDQRLCDIILRRAAVSDGVRMSNERGWHSEGDFLAWPEPEIAAFKQRITATLSRMIQEAHNPAFALDARMRLVAWANVSRDGAYNAIHNHSPALFSGVYYAATGAPSVEGGREGLIEFVDPRPGPHGGPLPTHAFHTPLTIQPEAGMMLVFPAWLLHFVHPYHGTEPRVSVAFNMRVKDPAPAD
ncbi:MAG: hypothetical protein HQ481_08990 [Alphaproteobacteria bacterium]|nr:hypothetical protein [Alphaproteobacteria bacterium]